MQQFEYTWFCLKREESQERDTIESKRKLRAEDVLPETSANVVPRVEVEREDPGNEVDPRPLCLLQFVARFLHFCAEVSTKSETYECLF